MSTSNLSLRSNDQCDRCNRGSGVAPAHNTRVWWCIDCGAWFCDPCWPLQISHGKGRTNRDGMPHERTDPRLQQALQDVLHPSLGSLPEDELDRLHEADEETTWFGMMSLAANSRRPVLTYISRNWKGKARSPISTQDVIKYPRIVSFVGETSKRIVPYP
jgi:ribosomal protein L37AE/L43A